jgi:hypothetical protein
MIRILTHPASIRNPLRISFHTVCLNYAREASERGSTSRAGESKARTGEAVRGPELSVGPL